MIWGHCRQAVAGIYGPGGEPLYVTAQVRPASWWFLRRVWLFLRIVWRPCETQRLAAATAWEVSGIVYEHALTGKDVKGRVERNEQHGK